MSPDLTVAIRGVSVQFHGVERHYRDSTALAGLDLAIEPGEFVALLGPSGCGKTTALRLLGGFDRPDAGTISVDGADVTTVPAHRRDMGMVFQAYSLFPNLTVADNVTFGLRIRRLAKAERVRRAQELLALVGLEGHGGRYPFELSGGQQQRVAIARALAIEPKVLLLDEPLSALDARVRTQLRGEIRSLQQRLGITTLFVTHDQSEALSMADRIGVLNAGRIEQFDTPENVYRHPATPFVAEFVGAMNRIRGRVGDRGEVLLLGQRVPYQAATGQHPAPGTLVDAMLRPEALEAVLDVAGPGEIVERTFLGSALRLRVALEPDTAVIVETSSSSDRLGVGARVGLRVLADRVTVTAPSAPSADSVASVAIPSAA
ncbi:ABC transporter ATP-binding protein [Conexibacter sp. DBS9H8]|uniref:ABC transporter ATP-binding protein n=1 Tax=Conexibacter sp. DBS9H8 TaxID=2937801 RepID=UPI00200ED682|nr:ABC transporter ATP-binding protein [Conexibacter sp. DBS9H8]